MLSWTTADKMWAQVTCSEGFLLQRSVHFTSADLQLTVCQALGTHPFTESMEQLSGIMMYPVFPWRKRRHGEIN